MTGRPLGTVVCPQPEAADTAVEVLEAGGNAIDAAIACALAQGVVDPLMCGIAGFGSLAVHRRGEGTRYLDFHAPAPLAVRPDMWEDLVESETRDGFGFVLKGRVNDLGYQSICVPMALAAYEEAHRRWGRLSWASVVAPAVRWAREGYMIRPAMVTFFNEGAGMGRVSTLDRLAYSPSGRALYLTPDGAAKPVGAPVTNPDLADTLETIAREGADAFYRGTLAERILSDMAENGGHLTRADLESALPVDADPLVGSYRGLKVVTNRPPGGGVMLLEMLNILEGFDLAASGHNTPETIRIVAEAMKRATIDKDRHVGDPAFVDVPLERLTDKAYAAGLADAIRRGERVDVPRLGEAPPPRDTTHISLVDAQGTAVSMTHSLGMPSGVITPGLGFMYNGCMGVFDPRPGRAGSIAPGKRRFSAMCPTMLFDGEDLSLVLGAPGGTQIVMGVLQTILNVVDFGMDVREAVAAPRFSATSDRIDVSNRLSRRVTRALEADGYTVVRNPYGHTFGWIHAIAMNGGVATGAADPGRDGVSYTATA